MRIDVLTLFPGICRGVFGESILARAQERGLIKFSAIDIRDFTHDKHRIVDDAPYGGGQGMLMKPEPVFEAAESVRTPESRIIVMTPGGKVFDHRKAQELAAVPHLILISGHYEGIDHRVSEHLAHEELSIGDYVLSNGTIAAVVVADAVARLLPGVLGREESAADDSFAHGLLEHPQYTRPAAYRGWQVPEILLTGNHAAIEAWRADQRLARTQRVRPDLLKRRVGTEE